MAKIILCIHVYVLSYHDDSYCKKNAFKLASKHLSEWIRNALRGSKFLGGGGGVRESMPLVPPNCGHSAPSKV